MKTNLINTFALVLLLTAGAYAQDSTTMSKKEIRRQEKAERKARVKGDLKEAGQNVGDAATEMGRGAKRKAKVAGEAIEQTADKAGTAIENKADRIKARRESKRAEKARRDTL